ncbi:hypothetical protein GLYMA_07G120202v4 [Glycine max]|nr:hypothetical protein GLYMA_07G120202v4 [Glycine max]KAH1086492.1 hypothetical protein GYH30_018150 [Glycine max]
MMDYLFMFDHCFTFHFHSILNRCLAQCINSLSKTMCMVVLLLLFIFTFDAFIIYIAHTIFYNNLLLLRGRTRTRTKGLHLTSILLTWKGGMRRKEELQINL